MSQHYTAKACVENQTGTEIRHVRLSHVYDHDFVDSMQWEDIANCSKSPEMEWRFTKTLIPTGYNYWRISFEAEGKRWYTPGSDNAAYWGIDTGRDSSEHGKSHTWIIRRQGDKLMACGDFHRGEVRHELASCPAPRSDAKPVHVIAHRCNELHSPVMAMYAGASGVEFDIQLYEQDYIVLHDGTFEHTVFKHAQKLSIWLEHAQKAADMFEGQFAVMLFDLKVACEGDKKAAAQHIRNIQKMAREKMDKCRCRPCFIFCISKLTDKDAFKDIIEDLGPNEGISFDEGQAPDKVQEYYEGKDDEKKAKGGHTHTPITNGWYGDGIMVAGGLMFWDDRDGRKKHLADAVALRNKGGPHAIKKVYYWTLANKNTIKSAFTEMALDAVLVNVPNTQSRLVVTTHGMLEAEQVLAESNGSLRLATTHDNPFAA